MGLAILLALLAPSCIIWPTVQENESLALSRNATLYAHRIGERVNVPFPSNDPKYIDAVIRRIETPHIEIGMSDPVAEMYCHGFRILESGGWGKMFRLMGWAGGIEIEGAGGSIRRISVSRGWFGLGWEGMTEAGVSIGSSVDEFRAAYPEARLMPVTIWNWDTWFEHRWQVPDGRVFAFTPLLGLHYITLGLAPFWKVQ